jgi:hypothetical protein
MTEIYKVIPDTENMYSISNFGNVKNNITNYILNPFMTDRGYLQVCINFSSRPTRITVNVHKLVARAFVPNEMNLPVVNHIDGIKVNNNANNLEWTTHSENNEHAVKMGLIKSGEDSYLAVLIEKDVLEIIDKLKEGNRNIDLAREYNVAHNTIDDIRCNRTWRYIERSPILGNGPIKKLKAEDIPVIRQMIKDGSKDFSIGLAYGVAPATINQIRNGKTWKNY